MISALIREFILPLLVFLFARSLLRGFLASFRKSPPGPVAVPTRPPRTPSAGGQLVKDPVCGTYVSAGSSLQRTVNGQVVHFCSRECSDKYPAG